MTRCDWIDRAKRHVIRFFRDDESGTTLVEFTVVLALFLLIFWGLIDFGRMAFHYVTMERAMSVAARVAAVRPPACPGVPAVHTRGGGTVNGAQPAFGTSCNAAAGICLNPGTLSCAGTVSDPTATEIWGLVRGAMPNTATIGNLSFAYSFDSNLGFVGGPYVPVVTVEIQNLNFIFISPLGALAGLAGATNTQSLGAAVTFPDMSVSLPAEDLAMGTSG